MTSCWACPSTDSRCCSPALHLRSALKLGCEFLQGDIDELETMHEPLSLSLAEKVSACMHAASGVVAESRRH
jgi:hypothetical protein